jgi:hypothetical protein
MQGKIAGHNITGFDLPYLLKSSVIHGVKVHFGLAPKGRYFPDVFFDTMKFWCSDYGQYISLQNLARALGCNFGKTDSGADFYKFPRAKQEQYLENDLQLTDYVFSKINESVGYHDNWMVFDIETAPLPEQDIIDIIGPFDPESVKVPKTYKDPEKIEAYKIKAESEHINKAFSKAQLNPELSVPVAIGYKWSHGDVAMDFGSPEDLLKQFWKRTGDFWQGQMERHNS